ncbi:MAG: AraC family transcriptional regulator [Bacteroidota bacterium]
MEQSQIDIRSAHKKFYLDDMGAIYERTNGEVDHPHRHNYYTVLFIKKAEGKHVVDFNSYDFDENEVHFVSPGQVHQVALTKKPDGKVFTFSKEFLIFNNISDTYISNFNLFKSFRESPPIKVDEGTFKRLENLVRNMEEYLDLQMDYHINALGALLTLFLINCSNSSNIDKSQIDDENPSVCLFRDFKRLVENNFHKWHKVKDYAAEINISPKQLSFTVKSVTGKVAKEFIQDRLIIEAKRLLMHTDMSVKEVAYKIGFEEPLHFSGFFKKKEGVSPSTFRNAL